MFAATGAEAGWQGAAVAAVCAGVPLIELVCLVVVVARSVDKTRDAVLVLWLLNVANVLWLMVGGFGIL